MAETRPRELSKEELALTASIVDSWGDTAPSRIPPGSATTIEELRMALGPGVAEGHRRREPRPRHAGGKEE